MPLSHTLLLQSPLAAQGSPVDATQVFIWSPSGSPHLTLAHSPLETQLAPTILPHRPAPLHARPFEARHDSAPSVPYAGSSLYFAMTSQVPTLPSMLQA